MHFDHCMLREGARDCLSSHIIYHLKFLQSTKCIRLCISFLLLVLIESVGGADHKHVRKPN
jgi:hypothetical protein